MNHPTLVIMAAGMGSRYGGLKQIDPIDPQGNKIIDFSIYDAVRAGFQKIVFVIKKENEADFRSCVSDRIGDKAEILYAYQQIDALPAGFTVPAGRVKPWGTAHAVLSAAPLIDGPFAVINADDFYGRHAFTLIHDFLTTHVDGEKYSYAMVGYALNKTLTENGTVSRGICGIDANGFLTDIVERTAIMQTESGIVYTDENGNAHPLPKDATVSMNLWGFTNSLLTEIRTRFETFLREEVPLNPLKAECYLPFVVNELLGEGKAQVTVLKSEDQWFGVTYQEDKPFVMESIRKLKQEGVYPKDLWT
ncbi:MAG: nucleotidyltransferase [Lachnospiraceae bacterium]|nr:nucleotidyltransferase [Lachnospiraceae bacterium]